MNKLKIFYIILAIFLVSCQAENTQYTQYSEEKRIRTDNSIIGYQVIVIDSCEYIYTEKGRLTHKGNCKFCEQRKCK